MSDATMSNEAASPDKAVAASDEYLPKPYAGGSAMLDASIAVSEQAPPEGTPVEEPIATNTPEQRSGEAKTARASGIAGAFEAEAGQNRDGQVSLQNNPDVPGVGMQGSLPDTDPVQLPNDPETNLPT